MTSLSMKLRYTKRMIEMNFAKLSEEGRAKCEKVVFEELWLKYYNDTLRKQGLITETEHRKMHLMISKRTQSLLKGAK